MSTGFGTLAESSTRSFARSSHIGYSTSCCNTLLRLLGIHTSVPKSRAEELKMPVRS
jgi:hypothetical protein